MDRVLGLDYGERRVGVAISDGLGVSAHPLRVVSRDNAIDELASIIAEYDIGRIVVGLPVSLSGSEGNTASAARDFADEVREATGLPVEMYDERFTSTEAERVLLEAGTRRRRRRQVRDKLAATVLLQGYLDSVR